MNKKNKIVVAIGILLIGIVAATTISSSFGEIRGKAIVGPPTFYFDGNSLVGNNSLILDSYPPAEKYFNLSGNNTIVFESDGLNITHFYDAQINVSLRVKTPGLNTTSVNIEIMKFSNISSSKICYMDISPTENDYFSIVEGSCLSNGEIDLSSENRLRAIISVNSTDIYQFENGGYDQNSARIEVYGA